MLLTNNHYIYIVLIIYEKNIKLLMLFFVLTLFFTITVQDRPIAKLDSIERKKIDKGLNKVTQFTIERLSDSLRWQELKVQMVPLRIDDDAKRSALFV